MLNLMCALCGAECDEPCEALESAQGKVIWFQPVKDGYDYFIWTNGSGDRETREYRWQD